MFGVSGLDFWTRFWQDCWRISTGFVLGFDRIWTRFLDQILTRIYTVYSSTWTEKYSVQFHRDGDLIKPTRNLFKLKNNMISLLIPFKGGRLLTGGAGYFFHPRHHVSPLWSSRASSLKLGIHRGTEQRPSFKLAMEGYWAQGRHKWNDRNGQQAAPVISFA